MLVTVFYSVPLIEEQAGTKKHEHCVAADGNDCPDAADDENKGGDEDLFHVAGNLALSPDGGGENFYHYLHTRYLPPSGDNGTPPPKFRA